MRKRRVHLWVFAASLAGIALVCTPGSGATGNQDPPLLVPWSRVGDFSLGAPKMRVEKEYGTAGHGFHVIAQQGDFLEGYYLLHGGQVGITFEAGRVEGISFGVP